MQMSTPTNKMLYGDYMKFQYRPSVTKFIAGMLLFGFLSYAALSSAFDGRSMVVFGYELTANATGVLVMALGILFLIAAIYFGYAFYIARSGERYIKIDESGVEFPPYPWSRKYRTVPLEKFRSVRSLSMRGIEVLEFTHEDGKITLQKSLFESATDYERFIEEADKWFAVQ